ncbi:MULTISPECIES: hypothetical protein [unclassified Streptomyces]|uniref:hypothetical protein n=1 Tax=unclassified Streptomyces TaxID=2593676 RepID=UPI000DB93B7A|nr:MULTISPECIES: hypothetical protein [unclassified Streptomyces]MYU02606.1 hypothetical protein [Streptomyces sp. SID8366]MYU63187.1 hypothetical protein [Streptomyces sp. SID69]RAJ55507.1 hypothetical protein K376_04478 [Streptomyces sp. PsTaAH-130]
MSGAIESKYDTTPLPEPDKSDGDGSEKSADNGKDLSGLVPEDKVAWTTAPSFNKDPQDIGGGGDNADKKDPGPPAGDFSVGLSSLRTAEASMLVEARAMVDEYEKVRAHVASAKDTVFGQTAKDKADNGEGHTSLASGYKPPAEDSDNPFAPAAREFAAEMNPAMERALLQVGSALEKFGEYIALVNHSGQVYGHADRESRFPPPPGKA